jgi:hypothetical protein
MTAVWASHHEELCSEGVVARWCLMGDTLGGQPWTPTLRLPYKCDGQSGRRMTVLWTFRRPSMCRPFPCQLVRNGLLDLTTILKCFAAGRTISTPNEAFWGTGHQDALLSLRG